MAKLTEKQKRFADEYIRLGNATEAARLAEYKQPHVQGSRLLENVSVKAFIDKQLTKIESERIMEAQEALELLTSIARGELKETVLMATERGIAEAEKPPDINQRTNALKEILKRYPIDKKLRSKMLDAQVRKAIAEAAIIENQADKLAAGGKVNDLLQALLDVKSGGDGSGDSD